MNANDSTQLNCEEVRDSLSLYALCALDADEVAGVEAHLVTCPDCRIALLREQEVVGSFATLTPSVAPDPAVRVRLLANATASAPVSVQLLPEPPRQLHTFQKWITPILSAAATLLLIGVGVLGVLLMRSVDQRDEAVSASRVLSNYVSTGGEVVNLAAQPLPEYESYSWSGSMLTAPGKDPVIVVTGCPKSGEYLTYFVWFSVDGKRSPAGKLTVGNDGSGWMTLTAELPVTEFDTIGITVVDENQERQDVLVAPLEEVQNG